MRIKVGGKYKSVNGEEHRVYGYSSVYDFYFNEHRTVLWDGDGKSSQYEGDDLVSEVVVENITPENEAIKKIALDALSLGMDVRQDQLRGGRYSNMSGVQAFEEWWKTIKL